MRLSLRQSVFLAVLVVILFPLAGCSSLSRGHEALLVLGDLSAGSEESRLKARTQAPTREGIRYAQEGRDYRADVYHPATPERGVMILVHGFTEDGRRDPRLVEFATTLSRVGFTVMVPELEGLRDYSISTREVEAIADAIRHSTQSLPEEESKAALAAISFAVGPAVIASLQEDTKARVSFIVSVGGYYDLTDMLRYVTTGEDRHGAGEAAPPPQREARWAVLMSQLHWLDDERDREQLSAIARRRLASEADSAEAEPVVTETAEELEGLGPQGRALYALVTNQDPARVEVLIDALPPSLIAELEALDLSKRDLDRLEAELVLIHGPQDRVIPFSHSRRLRDALPEGQARLFEASGLEHVAVSPGWRDGWGLWRAVNHVLRLGEQQQ
ncbi:hypothetical protein KG088_08995 [Halomonas sp. TRM85114]|uniref:alpha/beta hydrolase n=1 Tax=Halomonas jincaotanensis TaxID=2810616 RepID=UPI001BD224EB|nr:hypothetical protein [Halomonas jincaotanensis]MBS9403765.1 hypothetical protein [Halomonas jincaotanensis]